MARRWSKKRRKTNPKNTKVYKTGMRNAVIGGSVLGLVMMAIFYKTDVAQQIISATPTYEG